MSEAKKILLGLTTTGRSDWRDKVEEIKELGIKEIALFPTVLRVDERQNLYRLLEQTPLKSIPYVHLREDFVAGELDYLMERYGTKVFSCHPDASGLALLNSLATYNSLIYLENPAKLKDNLLFSTETFTRHQIFGVCLDLSHYQQVKDTDKQGFKRLQSILSAYPIDINHIGAYHASALGRLFGARGDSHQLNSLRELDYLKGVPDMYLGKYICIELENSLLEQQQVQKYLEMILKNRL